MYQHGVHSKVPVPTSIINLRDSTKINASIGKEILAIFAKAPLNPSILESFAYMDRREDQLRVQRDSDPNFDTLFDEYNTLYKQNPETFRPHNSQSYYKKDFKKGPYNKGHHHNHNHGKYQPKQQIISPEKDQVEEHEFGGHRGNGNYRGKRGGGPWNRGRGSANGRGRGAPRFHHRDRNGFNGYFNGHE